MKNKFSSMEEWSRLIAAFESGTLGRAEWTHAEHLAVACWYVATLGERTAMDRMRAGIRHLNVCMGGENTDHGGYHETLTRFWIGVVANFLKQEGGAGTVTAVNRLVAAYSGRRDLWKSAYRFDVVKSVEARRHWVPPDAAPPVEATAGTGEPVPGLQT